jgi:fructose-1,6-bisphosphatase I
MISAGMPLQAWLTAQDAVERDGGLGELVACLAAGCVQLSRVVATGPLRGLADASGVHNVQGEVQLRLDQIADQIVGDALLGCASVAAVVSEERDDVTVSPSSSGRFLVAYDPLDGSSNVAVNLTVGTIFSVTRAPSGVPTAGDFLRPGIEQIAAGYCLYGPSLQLVLTLGDGVVMFTFDPEAGAFCLSRAEVSVPREASEFAINASNQRRWDAPVQRWFEECLAGAEGVRGRDFNMRWIASLVAEVHRLLTRGGVFLYPMDARLRAQGRRGRLRLLVELAPMAMLLEQAGGAASTGTEPLMQVCPGSLHERAPVVLGARDEVARLEGYYREMRVR